MSTRVDPAQSIPTGPGSLDHTNSTYHFFPSLPTPRIVTYNVRSYSSNAKDVVFVNRKSKIRANLLCVMRHADVVLVQETKLQNHTLYKCFDNDWLIYHNPYFVTSNGRKIYSAKAGTEIYVSRKFARNFNIVPECAVAGYVQSVTFYPLADADIDIKHPYFSSSFSILNCYLPAPSAERHDKERILRNLPNYRLPGQYLFAGGDWNIILHPTESSSGHVCSATTRKLFNGATAQLGIREVHHPAKTFLSDSKAGSTYISKLDRIFTSFTDAEYTMMRPFIWLPPHPTSQGWHLRRPVTTSLSSYPLNRPTCKANPGTL